MPMAPTAALAAAALAGFADDLLLDGEFVRRAVVEVS